MIRGEIIPGFSLKPGRSIRKWRADSIEEAERYLDACGIPADKLYTMKFISPAQAEKLDSKLKKDDAFISLWEKPEGKLNVVPVKYGMESINDNMFKREE
jgi:hypothetical protein